MKKIPLNHGEFALVDDADFNFLNQWRWRLNNKGYATRTEYLGGGRKNEKQRNISMHALINGTPKGFHTDHINRNKLDNRRKNLRTATCSQNVLNSKLSRANTSGYKGVSWYQNAWVAEIKVNRKKIYLGRFKKITNAIKARKRAEKIYNLI